MPDFDDLMAEMDEVVMEAFKTSVTLPSGQSVSGIFDIPTEEGQLARLQIDYNVPVISMLDADAALVTQGNTLIIKGQKYTAGKRIPDGGGMTVIQLTEWQPDPETGRWK